MCVFKYHAFIFCMRPPRWRSETAVYNSFLKACHIVLRDCDDEKRIFLNSNNQSQISQILNPSYLSKISFPAVAHSTEQISNSNNSGNSKQILKNVVNETGAQTGSIDEKSPRRKISHYFPFKARSSHWPSVSSKTKFENSVSNIPWSETAAFGGYNLLNIEKSYFDWPILIKQFFVIPASLKLF